MIYRVLIERKKDVVWFQDQLLPGIVPDHVLHLMQADVVEKELDLCRLCDVEGGRCHVIDEFGRKYCPVLFHDAVKPREWTVADVV